MAVIAQDAILGIVIGAILIKYNEPIAYYINKTFWVNVIYEINTTIIISTFIKFMN